ncbi:MAG: NAD(P)/FAD-dependent oxidoreductase [Candidatus Aminicenantes bacterium]|nr:NAD(P)/FAD-dependent oxidoreductase [Candidatus Aminicenantes bacterium]
MKTVPVVIVGGGPAGIAAAVQLSRMGIETVLFEQEALGGLMREADWIENDPGFPSGIKGEDLARRFCESLEHRAVDTRKERVLALDYPPAGPAFTVATDRGRLAAERVIVASGTKPKSLPLFDRMDEAGRSHIYFDRTKIPAGGKRRVAVIGAGDIALDYALGLSLNPGHEVTIFCRAEKSRALDLLQERISRVRTIDLRLRSELDEVLSIPSGGLRLSGKSPAGRFSFETDDVLVAIGREPCKDFYTPQLLGLEGELIASELLFLTGDVKNGLRRQVGIAVGDGLAAAMAVAERRSEVG